MAHPQFVEGWDSVSVLGEGAFAEVRLLVHRHTQDTVAVKCINTKYNPAIEAAAKKEIMIMKHVRCQSEEHVNIVQILGSRLDNPPFVYIFLEYINGGELFDRIEPDIGMPSNIAQGYFNQLMCGIEYLHSMGIAHRDIKPENLLLDADTDVLKITDFGMATIFRAKGKERLCNTRCGTMAYVAPEMVTPNPVYSAPAVDVWSSGVVLVAMLVGELPWSKPQLSDLAYKKWVQSANTQEAPWKKLGNVALSLVRKMLEPNPKKRATVKEAMKHRWCSSDYTKQRTRLSRVNSDRGNFAKRGRFDRGASGFSQPSPHSDCPLSVDVSNINNQGNETCPNPDISPNPGISPNPCGMSFSQPVKVDDLILDSQTPLYSQQTVLSQGLAPLSILVRRMTRFCVSKSVEMGLKEVKLACEAAGFEVKRFNDDKPQLTIKAVDRYRSPVIFKIDAIDYPDCYDKTSLLYFRLSSGDGLEFKRLFIDIRRRMENIVCKEAYCHNSQLASSSQQLLRQLNIQG